MLSPAPYRPCPTCGTEASTPWNAYSPDEWQVVRGGGCNLTYLRNPVEYEALEVDFAWEATYEAKPRKGGCTKLSPALRVLRQKLGLTHRSKQERLRKWFRGGHVLDIGCGGGLLSEPMARLGATVTGADASGETLPVARLHAAQSGLDIEYLNTTAEDLAREDLQYDVILAMEVIEHVADPLAFLTACTTLLKPGGLLLCSTLNRTTRSYAMVVFGAERVMGWLPVGTHDWSKFITPDELFERLRQAGLEPVDKKGMVFAPLSWRWSISDVDLQVNYVTASLKPPKSSC